MKKRLVSIMFMLLTGVFFAQENEGIPPSPSVASLVTVEKDSVNNSGIIAQSVPLWEIKLGKYTFPITLFYSSTGIRVEEISSYVGAGWNLSAGGVITRSVIDLPDDMNNTIHGKGILHNNIGNETKSLENDFGVNGYNETTAKNFFKEKVNESLRDATRNDTQPDIFYFNFFGRQGKFIFNENKEIVSLTNDNYKYSYQLAGDNSLLSFTIIDTQGIVYVFSEREFSETLYKGGTAWDYLSSRSLRKKELDYFSSWHLKSVTAPNNRSISFEYESETLKYEIRGASMGKICGTEQCEDANINDVTYRDILNDLNGAVTEYIVDSKKIKEIKSDIPDFKVSFSNTAREDLDGGKKLSSILITNLNNLWVNRYNFEYSYFISPNAPVSNNYEYKRLRLDRIRRNSKFFQEFEYYENHQLPNRKSTEQDYWGYYNKNGATSLIPKVYLTSNGNQPPYKYHIFQPLAGPYETYGQISRNVNSDYIHMGMLKKITYQTGGGKTFFYEPNDFTHPDYTSMGSSIQGNGVRLQKIEYFDGVNIETLSYDYNSPVSGTTSGKLSYLPQFAVHIPWNFFYDNYLTDYTIYSPKGITRGRYERSFDNNTPDCYRGNGGTSLNYTPTSNPYNYFAMTTRRYSVTQIPLASNIENQLVYETITIKEGNNGEKEYKFNTLGALGEVIPSSFDQSSFDKPVSYKTYNWYLDDTTPFQTGHCFGNSVVPLGAPMLTILMQYVQYLDLSGASHPFSPSPNWNRYFGVLNQYTYFNESGEKVFKEQYEYDTKGNIANASNVKKVTSLKHRLFMRPWGYGWSYTGAYNNGAVQQNTLWVWSFNHTYYGIGLVPTKSTKTYFYDNETKSISTVIDKTYTLGNLLDGTSSFDSKGDKYQTLYKYPLHYNLGNNTYQKMVDKNMIYPIHKIIVKNDSQTIEANISEYSDENGGINLKRQYLLERKDHSFDYDLSLSPNSHPSIINKDSNMKLQIEFLKYDNVGNITEYKKKGDTNTVLLWGYNNNYPIAKIENMTYANIQAILAASPDDISITRLQELSNGNDETLLKVKLQKVRDLLDNSLVTTFTYKHLVGVTSITDPKGETINYTYDDFGRLVDVKDRNNKLISKNKYHYKNE
ncbi:MAG: RHS repeat protein [Flavobacteriaceae bacterium]